MSRAYSRIRILGEPQRTIGPQTEAFKRVYRRYGTRKQLMEKVYQYLELHDGDVRPCALHQIYGMPESSAR